MDKELLHTKVVREIISLISSGVYNDGRALPAERKLCEQFSVSRGTIRQGLGDLEKLGIINIRHGSGAYVRKFSHGKLPGHLLPPDFESISLADIIVARGAIELAAIELACEKASSKDFARMEKLINNMAKMMDNLPEFLKCDLEFHQTIVQASGNMVLVTAFEAISEYHKYSQVFTSLHEGEEQVSHNYHHRMLAALQKRDKKLSRKALAEHLEHMQNSSNRKNC